MQDKGEKVGMDVEEQPKNSTTVKTSNPPDANDDFENSKKKTRTKSPAPPRPKTPTTIAPVIKPDMTKSSAIIAEIKKRKLGNADMSTFRLDSTVKSPALSVVTNLVEASLASGRELNEAVSQSVDKVLDTCESLLLEIRSLSDAREESRELIKKESQKRSSGMCPCGSAAAMLPKVATIERPKAPVYDEISEDHTDKALLKLEASLEKLRDLAGMIQKTSMDKEAELIQKITVSPQVLLALSNMVDRSKDSAATRLQSSADQPAFTSAHVAKLENWYGTHPQPYRHELCSMSKILKLSLYSPDQVSRDLISESNIERWFTQRRERETEEHVQAATFEAQQAGGNVEELRSMQHAAADDIRVAIHRRIETLRHRVAPNAIIEEYELLRAKYAPRHSQVETSGTGKRKRGDASSTQEDETIEIVKLATMADIIAIQRRLDGLLAAEKSPEVLDKLHKVVFLLRSLLVPRTTIKKLNLIPTVRKIAEFGAGDEQLTRTTGALLKVLMEESSGSGTTTASSSQAAGKAPRKAAAGGSKFSPEQLQVLEQTFVEHEMPELMVLSTLLDHLNSIRDPSTQPERYTMVQLVKWFEMRYNLQYPASSSAADGDDNENEAEPGSSSNDEAAAANESSDNVSDSEDDRSVSELTTTPGTIN